MDTASKPHRIYLFICRRYQGRLAAVDQRQSNNYTPAFTNKEVLTIATASYVFGLIEKRTSISEIHRYAQDHLTRPDRIQRLIGLLSIAFAWTHIVGERRAEQEGLLPKREHGRRQRSLFRYGLDH